MGRRKRRRLAAQATGQRLQRLLLGLSQHFFLRFFFDTGYLMS